MPARVELECHHAVARVTLRYPQRFNAMSRAMWRELKAVFERIAQDASLRCVVVTGAGSHFCAGGDISEYPEFRFDPASLRVFHEQDVWGALQAMLDCDLPVLAKIRGNCMGAGLEIASCCDIRLAAQSARFGAPIARLGFTMAPSEAALLLREVGTTVARQILLEAAVLDAHEMLARGFLTRVVADEALADHTQATLLRMAALSPMAARLNKQTFRELNQPLAQSQVQGSAIDIEAGTGLGMTDPYAYAPHPEHREGVAAFLEKRPAAF